MLLVVIHISNAIIIWFDVVNSATSYQLQYSSTTEQRLYRNTTPATPAPKIQPAGWCGNINSVDQLRHTRSVDYSAELVLLNKQQISGGRDQPNERGNTKQSQWYTGA